MGKALHRYCREENITFFLVCLLNPGNVKKGERISKNCCLQSREKTTEKPAEVVMDEAMTWKGSKSLFPAMATWRILTHKRKHPSLVLSADSSQHGILLSKKRPLSITVSPVCEQFKSLSSHISKNKRQQESQRPQSNSLVGFFTPS